MSAHPQAKLGEHPPISAAGLCRMEGALRRWLEERENGHLRPIDPAKVKVRPHTKREAEARARRLRARVGVRVPGDFRIRKRKERIAP